MTILISILLFLAGLAAVYFGANWLVDGASSLARKMNVPNIIIGLTVVAFGTSAPEMTVSFFSAYSGNTGIAVGNVVGSNIFNIFFILGISAMVYPLVIHNATVWKEIPLSMLAAAVLFFMANDIFFDAASVNIVSRVDGIILLFFFAIFLYYTFGVAKNSGNEYDSTIKNFGNTKTIVLIVIGFFALVAGGRLIVAGAVDLARMAGMSEALIGLTIVAAGTSVPELATSVVAAYKKNADIAVGNIIGSNIFNIFFILGGSALIRPLPLAPGSNIDILAAFIASLMVFTFCFTMGKKRIDRMEGVFLVAVFVVYMSWLIVK